MSVASSRIPEPEARGTQLRAVTTTNDKRPWYKRDFYVGRAVKPVLVMNFARQVSSFLESGIPILEALAIVAEETTDRKMREVLADMRTALISGRNFGDAVAAHPKVFPGYFISMVRSAELTGKLDEVLHQVAGYMDRDLSARRQVKSALTYPAFVLFLALMSVLVMSIWVLPKFQGLYDGLGAKLPVPTRVLLGLTDFVASNWYLILAAIGLCFLAIAAIFGGERGKPRRDLLALRMPVLAPLFRLIAIERFCRVLSALANAGVPLPEAIDVAARSTNNTVFIDRLREVRAAMMRGEGLARPIALSGLFPGAARQMIRVGETTGSLDHQLETASVYYGRELAYRLKRTTDLFEPIVIVIVGGVVGLVAIAQVSAMYSVFKQIRP